MEAEGKNSEANRIHLRDGPLAAIQHFGEATLARNVRPTDITAWLRDIHNAGALKIVRRSANALSMVCCIHQDGIDLINAPVPIT